ncbi:MAG: glycoside hydrolase family 127 protein, partial [Bryobacteraceae bacterium]
NLIAANPLRQITQASVPDDPDAPEIQEGTVPESSPFDEKLFFVRKDVAQQREPFSLTAVRLLPSPFFDAQEANRALLHRLPADRLLHTFRINAGLPSTAEPLGGWERPDCELRGHYCGHFLSACALMHASTGDAELKTKGDYLVAELAKCQEKLGGGYLSAFPTELFDRLKARKQVWAPFYTIHKIMAGMLDMHQHCANEQALKVLRGMADWTDRWTAAIPPERMQMVLDTEYGGMNEVLYNLAAATNNGRYAEVGDRFTKQRFFNPLALRRDQLRGLHTNTHIPQVIGAARRYEISGDPRFHDVANFFWETVVESRTYATGGTSNNEGWLVQPGRLAQELALGVDTNECCCAYNMMKLTRHLYEWNGAASYFDYYERVLYNHRLGTIRLENGETQYYLGARPGSWRTFATEYNSFWCCNGTGVEEYSKLNDSIYFHDADGIFVNLFIPSALNWAEKKVRLRQTNDFPTVLATRIEVKAEEPSKFVMRIRVPSWVSGFPQVKVNGRETEISAAGGSYVSIMRTWKSGDQVEIEFPAQVRVEAMPDDKSLQVFLYGPFLLAGEVGSPVEENLTIGPEGPQFKKHPPAAIPALRANKTKPSEWIVATGQPLTFRITGQERPILLRPFHTIGAGQPYTIYWQVS